MSESTHTVKKPSACLAIRVRTFTTIHLLFTALAIVQAYSIGLTNTRDFCRDQYESFEVSREDIDSRDVKQYFQGKKAVGFTFDCFHDEKYLNTYTRGCGYGQIAAEVGPDGVGYCVTGPEKEVGCSGCLEVMSSDLVSAFLRPGAASSSKDHID